MHSVALLLSNFSLESPTLPIRSSPGLPNHNPCRKRVTHSKPFCWSEQVSSNYKERIQSIQKCSYSVELSWLPFYHGCEPLRVEL